MYPKGSPKFNLQKAALGVKKTPSNNRKRRSPKGSKPRAQWNMGLQKSLVDILHEHNNDYHRAQNGWSGDTWNLMTKIFKDRNKHVNFTKSQLQDQEKELKRQYCMLKEARKQSGAGWCEKSCRIQADDALWDNLLISFPKIGKFKKYDFPLFDRLGDLYDGQIAEGTYNFTSISEPSQIDEENEEVQSADTNDDDDLQIIDGGGPSHLGAEVNPVIDVDAAQKDELTNEGGPSIVPKKKPTNGGGPAIVPKKKPTNELNKPNKSDAMVAVVDRYVKMKEKQAEEEKAESNVFTISKCISAVQNMKELSRVERVKSSKVFKIAENRETFLTWAAQDEESAIMWLRGELQDLS